MTDQDKYTDANDVRYVAVPVAFGTGCIGCAFALDAYHGCSETPCNPESRDDGLRIVWIKAA